MITNIITSPPGSTAMMINVLNGKKKAASWSVAAR